MILIFTGRLLLVFYAAIEIVSEQQIFFFFVRKISVWFDDVRSGFLYNGCGSWKQTRKTKYAHFVMRWDFFHAYIFFTIFTWNHDWTFLM